MSTPGDLFEALGREARARLGGDRAGADPGVRVYRGRNVEELIPRIERDLGADALIVRRREGLRGGVLGFFQHAFIEIEAMPGAPRVDIYDDTASAAPAGVAPPSPAPPAPPTPAAPQTLSEAAAPPPSYPLSAELAAISPSPAAAPAAPSAPQAPEISALPHGGVAGLPTQAARLAAYASGSVPTAAVQRRGGPGAYVTPELAALARAEPARAPRPSTPVVLPSIDFQELLGPQHERPTGRLEPSSVRPAAPIPLRPAPTQAERRTVVAGSHTRARAGVMRSLRRYGISEEFAVELIEAAGAHTLPLAPRAGLAHAVRSTLAQRIPVVPPLPAGGAAIVVLGAGGSGKTTCCIALLDAYRAGSTLSASYATLLRPGDSDELSILLSPHIVKPARASSVRSQRALRKVRSEGLAILDTPSLSPADRNGIRALATLLGELKPERVVVALPATLGAAPASQLLEAFAPLGANALAVTHAEETDQIGVAVEAACRSGVAPEYVLSRAPSTGWRLHRADPTELAARILP